VRRIVKSGAPKMIDLVLSFAAKSHDMYKCSIVYDMFATLRLSEDFPTNKRKECRTMWVVHLKTTSKMLMLGSLLCSERYKSILSESFLASCLPQRLFCVSKTTLRTFMVCFSHVFQKELSTYWMIETVLLEVQPPHAYVFCASPLLGMI
jgi:hypothetical protein